ncbi:MAG: ankyrin repeat domain-containing protein [Thermofilum sp.]|nr:ankyrin repeat domain-containing protein [Thermofilum sp.]
MTLADKLFAAVKKGDVAEVKRLLEGGLDANTRDEFAETPLHWTARIGDVRMAELLIKYGGDINARNNAENTPLHVAVAYGHLDMAEFLINHGADINAKNEEGWTPLHVAVFNGHLSLVKLLLEKGADPNVRDNEQKTALDVARENGLSNIANLIEKFSKKTAKTSTTKRALGSKTLQIVEIEPLSLIAGEWGKLTLKVNGMGEATIKVEGDIEWLNPEDIQLAGESVIEIPVKPRKSGQVPLKVSIESSGLRASRIVWLKVDEKVARCPACGAHIIPGAKYCWNCGAQLT